MTMMALGPVVFDLVSNLHEHQRETKSAFAEHKVVGGDPIYEAMGGDGGTFTLQGTIHPEHFGVNGALAALEQAQAEQIPLPLMRGDFRPLGWVVIDTLTSSHKSLNEFGRGREIEFTVSLIRVGAPGVGSARSILNLFQGLFG